MRILLSLALGVSAFACNKKDGLGCGGNDDCPPGNVCEGGACFELCANDLNCVVGFICDGEICVRGTRQVPTIERVTGNGTPTCPQARDGFCFADGLVVYGTNLLGSSFVLNSTTGGRNFSLVAGARHEQTRADVLLPPDLVADDYLLVAANAAGEAQATASILQGEPSNMTGDQVVDRINQTPYTSRVATQRLPLANALITHLNTGSIQIDPAILPPGGGNYTGNDIVGLINTGATISIAAVRLPVGATAGTVAAGDHTHPGGSQLHMQRTAGTAGTAVAIADATLMSLCGDADGCDMHVGYRYFSNGADLVRAILYGPPCRFHIDSNRHWAVAPNCLQRYEVHNTPGLNDGGTTGFQPYASGGYGIDGSTTDGSTNWNVIEYYANSSPVCTVAEAGPGGTDSTAGFFFWMTINEAGGGFADANRTCELLIED